MTVVKSLGELSLITMGQSPSSTSYNTDGDGLPFFQGNADFGLETPIASTWCTEPKKIAEPGDLLVSVRAPIGAVNVADSECCIGRGLVSIRPDTSVIDPDYLKQCLLANSKRLASLGTGSTFKAVGKSVLNSFEIPVYGLDEQKSIARRFSKVMILNRLTRKMLAKTEELVQSRFVEMFGDPSRERVTLADVCDFYSGGTPSKRKPEYWNGTLPWFSPKDMKRPVLDDSIDHISDIVVEQTSLRLLPSDTVVIVVRGMILAHDVPVSIITVPATINQDMKALIPKPGKECDSVYLAAAIRSQENYLLAETSSSAHGTKKIDATVLGAVSIPEADIHEQRKFAAFVRQVESLKTDLNQQLDRLNTLYDSLTQRYFA